MLSSLSRITKGRPGRRSDRSPFSSPFSGLLDSSPLAARRGSREERRRPAADFDQDPPSAQHMKIDEEPEEDEGEEEGHAEEEDEGIDEDDEGSPLLPIFSAAHLDALPVYNLTHTIRLLVVLRCETTLSWDQLRSPQVSQFLVKPIQQEIRTSHFSRATLYALMANCLQFSKEAQMNPGNSGTSKTRALVCELLAIKLLREFSIRELVRKQWKILYSNSVVLTAVRSKLDALSYDFSPLQGLVAAGSGNATPGPNWDSQQNKLRLGVARISTLEIAIRAQSKRFLAHPLVVQQLEAIWAGNIVFHSAADNLHRPPERMMPNQNRGYGAIGASGPVLQASPDRLQPAKQRAHVEPVLFTVRRSATLYDPRDASLFKLSRLRVPRYRQFLSTCSFAMLLGLYLAVLVERLVEITILELVFWFWSAGFMLDEIVGFNEQGFSLYILSFWNSFDVGILLLLICYYCMRVYSILMPEARQHHVADMAYDLLAANAVLLFPRLFSALDHYRYFSQLLIAFRIMARDLVAVFVLIVISCSGFFVAFTLSFGNSYNAGDVAYALFQMLMGFTPAAWDSWGSYNVLGKAILTLFLFICHFLIVTILITVLTNSFMAIVQNANEEHQFVFAVNTISMVKSDALFSYIAPTNVLAWVLAPLRYIIPFRQFVRLNRTVIKITHFPVLFVIYAYERVILRSAAFEPTDLIENRGRPEARAKAFEAQGTGLSLFSPRAHRLREPSVATFHKDRALAEVFRQPYRGNTGRRTQKSHERRNVVNSWMSEMGPNGTASPPIEQDRSVVDRLEARRLARRRSQALMRRRQVGHGRSFTEATMSVVSDPEEFVSGGDPYRHLHRHESSDLPIMSMDDLPEHTDADGDDELVTNDDEENMALDRGDSPGDNLGRSQVYNRTQREDYFQQTPTAKARASPESVHWPSRNVQYESLLQDPNFSRSTIHGPRRVGHSRNVSTNTILFDPLPRKDDSSSSPSRRVATAKNSAKNTGTGSGALTPASAGRRTPKCVNRTRPIMPPRTAFQSTPNLAGMLMLDTQQGHKPSLAFDIGSDIGDNKAIGGGFVPASFATQMAFATGTLRAGHDAAGSNDDQRIMSKMMMARMTNLEEGFRDVIKEVKDWRKGETMSADDRAKTRPGKTKSKKISRREGKKKQEADGVTEEWVDEQDVSKDEKGSSI